MKRNIILLCSLAVMGMAINSCDKDADKYRDYLGGGEIIYPGLANNISAAPGNYRVKLSWKPSPDPTVAKYKVFWNNGADSIEVAASTHNPTETLSVIVPSLTEYTYSFTIYSYDEKGNRSIPREAGNIKVFGDSYKQSLTNRFIVASNPYELVTEGIKLFFETPDTININTEIRYTAEDGPKTASLSPEATEIVLPGYKAGTKIYYQSTYKPVSNAIDTFTTKGADSLGNIISPLNKSLFKEVSLPNDVGVYGSNTGVKNLWNGNTSPTGYPDIFHSDGDHPLPHHFTFDLGQSYDGLAQFEIIGRDCCNNPTRFEIWGINDLTNAATSAPGNNPGWKAEAEARGWVLLKEVVRSDDGIAPFKVTLPDNLPTVRYIRIRVLTNASGDPNYSNISEITFWKK